MTAPDPTREGADTYRPFPNLPSRNLLQRGVEIPLLVRALALPRGVRVLEVGCGRGVALRAFAERLEPELLVGIDSESGFLSEFIVAGGLRVAGVVAADVRSLPFPEHAFDLVVDFGTTFHIRRADVALHEIARVLASGGVFATETRWAQRLSHPIRTRGQRVPWAAVDAFAPRRNAGLWASYVRRS